MSEKILNEGKLERLETVDWGERHFGSLTTNRAFPRRAMLRLVDKGLVRSVGLVELCDDYGFILESGRCREGFVLTDAGHAALEAYRYDCRRALDALVAERFTPSTPGPS